MTKTKALKNFISKFLDYSAEGNSVTSVLTDATANADVPSGGGASTFVISMVANYSDNTMSTDKTYAEIKAAVDSNAPIIVRADAQGRTTLAFLAGVFEVPDSQDARYRVAILSGGFDDASSTFNDYGLIFATETEDGYPTAEV